MKVAIEYSGHLRFIQETFENLKQALVANEPVEFYFFLIPGRIRNQKTLLFY